MADIASCIPMQQEDPEEKPFETLREGMSNDWLEEIVDQDDSERSWIANNIMRIRMRRSRTQRENQEHQDSLDAEEERLATRLVTGVFLECSLEMAKLNPLTGATHPPGTPPVSN